MPLPGPILGASLLQPFRHGAGQEPESEAARTSTGRPQLPASASESDQVDHLSGSPGDQTRQLNNAHTRMTANVGSHPSLPRQTGLPVWTVPQRSLTGTPHAVRAGLLVHAAYQPRAGPLLTLS